MFQKDPMPLSKLPEHLRAVREGNRATPVVNMGTIKESRRRHKAPALSALMLVALSIGTFVAYDSVLIKQHTIVVDVESGIDPSMVISKIVSDGGASLLSVKQNKDSTYEVTVSTRQSRRSFLELIRRSTNVRNVEIGSP